MGIELEGREKDRRHLGYCLPSLLGRYLPLHGGQTLSKENPSKSVEARFSIENGVSLYISSRRKSWGNKWDLIKGVKLVNPSGKIVAYEDLEKEIKENSFEKYLNLENSHPLEGSYRIQILNKKDEILSETATEYKGQTVSILDVEKLHGHPSRASPKRYILDNVDATLKNSWQFPVEVKLQVKICNNHFRTSQSREIQPGEREDLNFELDIPISKYPSAGDKHEATFRIHASRLNRREEGITDKVTKTVLERGGWSVGILTSSSEHPLNLEKPKRIDNPVLTENDITDRSAR